MTSDMPLATLGSRPPRRYVRAPVPLHFPAELPLDRLDALHAMPEGDGNFQRRVLLYALLKHELGRTALVVSDLLIYWDPTDTQKCFAPDLALQVGSAPAEVLETWKTWERGAPHVGVEIVSPSDRSPRTLDEKLAHYRRAGVGEVVRFDPQAGGALRFWDFFDGDLVERDPSDPQASRCDALGLYWCACDEGELGPVLRLARDPQGTELLRTPAEAEAARASAALARVAELEAALAKLR
jgi:hypothetical protein